MSIHRRAALQLFIAAISAGALPSVADARADTVCATLVEGLDLNAARALGREYLASHPADSALDDVLAKLDADGNSLPSAIRKLQEMIRYDYVAGRTVNLSGWFLSRTEGRIFARIGMCPQK
jgi:hypothetical protein